MDLDLQPVEEATRLQVRDKVYERLRTAIIEDALKPGNRLVERKLAQKLGVSRTPVREAIRKLELEGLVYHVPRVGAIVAEIDDQEVLEVYRIRAVLEGLVTRMAAEKIVPEQLEKLTSLLEKLEEYSAKEDLENLKKVHQQFNDVIYKAAGSQRLYNMITPLVDYINRFVRVGYSRPGRMEEATAEHRQLVEAIKMRDGDLAELVAREHIKNSRYAYFCDLSHNRKTGK